MLALLSHYTTRKLSRKPLQIPSNAAARLLVAAFSTAALASQDYTCARNMLRRLHFRVQFYFILAILGCFANVHRPGLFLTLVSQVLAVLLLSALLGYLAVNWPRIACIVAADSYLAKLPCPLRIVDPTRWPTPFLTAFRALAPFFSPRFQRPPPCTV